MLHQLLSVFACSEAHAPQPYVSSCLSLRLGHSRGHIRTPQKSRISAQYILASHLNQSKYELPHYLILHF